MESCGGRNAEWLARQTFSTIQRAQEVRALVTEGVVDSMSVVFHNPVRQTIDGVPHIVGAELLSTDFVSIPSNRDARVVGVRSLHRGRAATKTLANAQVLAAEAELLLLDLDLDALRKKPTALARTYANLAAAERLLATLDRR